VRAYLRCTIERRTRDNVCQRPQRRLYLRHGAAVLSDEVRVHAQPPRRHRQHLGRPLRRLLVHFDRCPNRRGLLQSVERRAAGVTVTVMRGWRARRDGGEVMARRCRGSICILQAPASPDQIVHPFRLFTVQHAWRIPIPLIFSVIFPDAITDAWQPGSLPAGNDAENRPLTSGCIYSVRTNPGLLRTMRTETKRPLWIAFVGIDGSLLAEGRYRVSNWKGFLQHVTTRSRKTRT
jgi:hypothetical protein